MTSKKFPRYSQVPKDLPDRKNKTWRDAESMSQAERVIIKFGGPPRLAKILSHLVGKKVYPSTIYRWMWPKEKCRGTGGLIPSHWISILIKAASLDGVLLTPEDLNPFPSSSRDHDRLMRAHGFPVLEEQDGEPGEDTRKISRDPATSKRRVW